MNVAERAADLVGRLTTEEKISQLQNGAPAIPRLHIASYNWWNEGLHGVARAGYATVFPQAIGLAATWDRPLIYRIADTISTEARAKYNNAQAENNYAINYGLTFWSPNINIDRDPRWGRGQETYGEDPFLTGEIGSAFVSGLQGDDKQYLKVVATPKHFAVHSGPELSRHVFDAVVSPHDLADTYLPAFRRLVLDSHAASVMCAYNAIDGSPACASTMLLGQYLRRNWHFDGYVVSDCAAITDVAVGHKFSSDLAHAAAASLLAGTDMSCGAEYGHLSDALKQGLVSEADIDAAARRLFAARMRLGMFDPPARVPYNNTAIAENDSPAHAALALETARASIVLLKNERGLLPLSRSVHSIAVIGPNAAALAALEGNYNGTPSHPVTPLAALERLLPGRVQYAQGAPYVEGVSLPVPETNFSHHSDRGEQAGLSAEYFNGDTFEKPAATRIDRLIDFDWNAAAPLPTISSKSFSVRWTGSFVPPAAGPITLSFTLAHCTACDDNETIRVWLNGDLVFDNRHEANKGRRSPTPEFQLTFQDTHPQRLRIEYTHDSPRFGAGLTLNWVPPANDLRRLAVAAAEHSDVVVAFVGLSPTLEGEEMPIHVAGFDGGDRTSIELPDVQQQLISALLATGKPLVLVLMNGSALALKSAAEGATSILEAWYPGQAGGTAIVDTLFGDNNPSGRLPATFYASTSQLPPFDDYSMSNRTYRYFSGEPLYRFGYGLSFTRFKYSAAGLSASTIPAGQGLTVTVTVQNTGKRDGAEIVEAYLVPRNIAGAAARTLVAFQKIKLHTGEAQTVRIEVDPRLMSTVSSTGDRKILAGDYDVFVGGEQPPSPNGIALPFRIAGSVQLAP